MRRALVLLLVASLMPWASAWAGETPSGPVGSEHHLTLPAGDVMVPQEAYHTEARRGAVDVTALDVVWHDEGRGIEMRARFAADPSTIDDGGGSGSITLTLVDWSRANEVRHFSLVYEGRTTNIFDGDPNNGEDDLERCGSQAVVSTTEVVLFVSATCIPADMNTLWASVFTSAYTPVGTGDGWLESTDRWLFANGLNFATLVRPGHDAAPYVGIASQSGSSADHDDTDPATERAVMEAAGDDLTVSRLTATAADDGSTVVVAELPESRGTSNLYVHLSGPDNVFLDGAVSGLDDTLAGKLAFNLAGEGYSYRYCSGRISHDAANQRVTIVFGPTCSSPGQPFTRMSAWVQAYNRSEGTFGESSSPGTLRGDVTFRRSAPPRPEATERTLDGTCPEGDGSTFPDTGGNPHGRAIDCLAAREITKGKADGTYDPGGTLSRGQVATFLARTLDAAGTPVPLANGDCPTNVAHGENLNRLVAAGIMPSNDCDLTWAITRFEMAQAVAAAIAYANGEPTSDPENYFADDEHLSAGAQAAIDIVAGLGIVTGRAPAEFNPGGALSRAQMATFLARLLAHLESV